MSGEHRLEDFRKVQVTGKSTFIISLPREWINDNKIERGTLLKIREGPNTSLTIFPFTKESEGPNKNAIIRILPDNRSEDVILLLISAYQLGYGSIKFTTKGDRMDGSLRTELKNFVRRNLVGTEIISDLSSELTLQVLLKYSDLSIVDAMRRMAVIATSMHQIALQALVSDASNALKEVSDMSNEVNRFSLYIVRLLKEAVTYSDILRLTGIGSRRECLDYSLIVKSVERLAKHAINIAENCLTLNQLSIDRGIYGGLERLSDSSLKLFNDSMEAFFERDPQKATEVVNNVSSIHNMKGDLILTIAKQASQDLPQLRLILESIIRTAEYAVDIAEAVLNITAFRVIVEE